MKRILVINGVNLNLLGVREKEIYGEKTYKELVRFIKDSATQLGVRVKIVQSNSESEIVECIQKAYGKYDGILINAGAYTHTSIAIADALRAVDIDTVEVHLSDINAREEFRKISYISQVAKKSIVGKGFDGYAEGLRYFASK